jgi:hypothetical protein
MSVQTTAISGFGIKITKEILDILKFNEEINEQQSFLEYIIEKLEYSRLECYGDCRFEEIKYVFMPLHSNYFGNYCENVLRFFEEMEQIGIINLFVEDLEHISEILVI